MALIMVTGGARSGKSAFAQKLALQQEALQPEKAVIYLATALAGDAEMRRRVDLHRRNRPSRWITVEEPYNMGAALNAIPPECGLVLVDCLTVWVTNMLLRSLEERGLGMEGEDSCWETDKQKEENLSFNNTESALEEQIYEQAAILLEKTGHGSYTTILVTNEVGWGVVPESYLGRLFRDIAGKVNQQVAARADAVYLVASGIPLKIKG
jgi:adenosylcobinamide kinase / adenosylcobinamide-phosphate guanylyltransferase